VDLAELKKNVVSEERQDSEIAIESSQDFALVVYVSLAGGTFLRFNTPEIEFLISGALVR
jgi:hypothetical protein